MNYLDIANSSFMFVLCLIPILSILLQTVAFIRISWKQGKEIGFSTDKMKQCIKSSAVFSIIPSLALVAIMVALCTMIGKFFPWLRLSNIGAGPYEAIAANIGFTATGAASYSELDLAGFCTIMITMNVGMCVAPLNVLFTLKTYDKTLRKAKVSNPFLIIATSAAFIGIICRLCIPSFLDFTNHLGMLAAITGALVMYACLQLGKKKSMFKEFGLSFGIIAGVIACIIAAALGMA